VGESEMDRREKYKTLTMLSVCVEVVLFVRRRSRHGGEGEKDDAWERRTGRRREVVALYPNAWL
jgi:hypothetical protein